MNSMPYQKVLRGLEPEHHHHATSSHLYEAGKSQDYEGIQATYLSQKQKRDLPMCGWDPIRSQDNINSKSSRDIAYRQAPVLAQRPPAGFNSPSLGIFAWQRLYHHFFTPLSRCFVYLKPPSTVAARLSLCVTFFFFSAQKKDDWKSFLSPLWIPLIARPPQHSLVVIPKGCVAYHAASTAYQARECSQGTSCWFGWDTVGEEICETDVRWLTRMFS